MLQFDEKLQTILMNSQILEAATKLSSNSQTNSLEGFHLRLNLGHSEMLYFF